MKRTSSKTKIKSLSKSDVTALQRYASFTESYENLSDQVKDYLMMRDYNRYGHEDIGKKLDQLDELEERVTAIAETLDHTECKLNGLVIGKRVNKYKKKAHDAKAMIDALPTVGFVKNMFHAKLAKIEKEGDLDSKDEEINALMEELKKATNELGNIK
jgi:hypothetical protein